MMLKIKLPAFLKSSNSHNMVISKLNERGESRESLKHAIKAYRLANNLKILNLNDKPDNEGFVKYLGVMVKSHTSVDMHKKGMTILEVKSDEDVIFNSHDHEEQDQFIRVIKGKIVDLENNLMFDGGRSYLIPKRQKHLIKYYKGTNAMVIYMPNLKLANNG